MTHAPVRPPRRQGSLLHTVGANPGWHTSAGMPSSSKTNRNDNTAAMVATIDDVAQELARHARRLAEGPARR